MRTLTDTERTILQLARASRLLGRGDRVSVKLASVSLLRRAQGEPMDPTGSNVNVVSCALALGTGLLTFGASTSRRGEFFLVPTPEGLEALVAATLPVAVGSLPA